jgi:autotransporter-associated beta strand protein
LNGGVTVNFDLSSAPASGNDQVLVGGALNLSGLNTIQISPLTLCGVGTYRLFVCGSVSGTGANLQLAGSPGNGLNAALNVTGTEVDLVVTAVAPSFTWHGDGSLNQWDTSTANWLTNGVAAIYGDGDFTLFNNTGSTTPAINITAPVSPASVTVNASVNYTFGGSGKITGVGSLTKTNTGTLILTTPNDYTGGTTINQGTIQVSDGSTTGATLGNGGVVDNASLVFDEPDGYDFTNVISGKGSLTQAGSGTMTFSGNNTYSGTTTISAGTLQAGDGTTTGTLGTNTVTDNAALAFNPNSASSVVQSGLITGNGTLTVLGGTVAVTAANNYSGTTTINSGGTLQLGNGGATGSVPAANITDNGTLAFDHSVNEANTTAITGSGAVNKLGVNTLTMNAANTYTGNTVISGGTVKIGAAGTIPSGSGFGNVDLDGGASAAGILDLNGFDTILNGINGTNNTVLGMVVNNSGTAINALNVGAGDATTTFSGLIEDNTGTGGMIELIKSGAGTFTLGGTNTYSGGTIISNGILALGSDNANSSGLGASNVIFRGGTLQLFGYTGSNGDHYNSPTNPLVVLAGQTGTLQLFQRGPTDNTGITAPLTGGGTLNLVISFERASIDGNWSAFTGLINVTAAANPGPWHFRTKDTYGYVNAAIYLNSGVIMYDNGNANATIDIGELGGTTGASLGLGTVAQNQAVANPTWRIGAKNTTNTFAGNIINDGVTTIIKVGTGTLNLSGQNTYSGSTTISNGVLALTNGVNGDGTIAKSTNIFINAGAILDVSGENTPTLTLGSTQTIGGSGTLNGALDNTSGAAIAPGIGATGTLTVTNTVALGGNIFIDVDHTVAGATNASLAAASITIPSGATLTVNQGANDLVTGDTFKLFKIGDSSVSLLSGLTVNLPVTSPDSVYTYVWDTSQLGVNGTITLTSGAPSTPPAPVAGFSGTPTSGIAPLNVTFTDASSGSITNWIWNFGDGNSVTNISNVSVNHSYGAGTYAVSLTVNGAGGSSLATSNNYIVVTAPAPVAGFSATPTNIFVTQTVTFTDASIGSITNWVWNFGDGSTAVTNTSNVSVNHAYAVAGTDTASLTVYGAGGSSSATQNIVVKPRPVLNKPVLVGSNLILSGVNGPAGQQYRILSTTNVALPLASWTPVYTNTFNADGSYGYTNSTLVNKADFLLLVSP